MIHSAIIGASFSQYVVLGSYMLRDIELQDLMTAGGGSRFTTDGRTEG